jgi:hypothetical protein
LLGFESKKHADQTRARRCQVGYCGKRNWLTYSDCHESELDSVPFATGY